MEHALAFDIGGANLKAATASGYTDSRNFALWKHPDLLAAELADMMASAPDSDAIVATMTGELADCYATKKEGVRAIVDALCSSAGHRPVSIYLVDGTFATPDQARANYGLAAASNWHALAQFAAQLTNGKNAILVDIGSTTCDVIPLAGGRVIAQGKTDTERLLAQELIYVGIERTPVCSVADMVPYRGHECPMARELFATTLDVHLLTEEVAERPQDNETADGRPATREYALARLARCVCADHEQFNEADGQALAEFISYEVSELLRDAIEAVSERNEFGSDSLIVLSGHGDFMLRRLLSNASRLISLREQIGADAARCAPAYAISKLFEAELVGK